MICLTTLAGLPGALAYSEAEIIASCTKLNYDYVYHRDRGDIEEYSKLFTDDAEFVFQAVIKGQAAIGEAARGRWEQAISRHFIQPVQIVSTGPDTANGVVYLNLYSAPRPAKKICRTHSYPGHDGDRQLS